MRILPDFKETHVYLCILVITNFITNHLFIFELKFYSDDWVQSTFVKSVEIGSALLNERPIMYLLLQIQGAVFKMNPFLYHFTAFIVTTIFLCILFFVIKRISADNNFDSNFFPFLVAIFFCLLFNKDEVYAWPTTSIANNCAYIFFLLSILFFLYRERRGFLFLSVLSYTLGIFTYELGIALPIFFAAYLICTDKKICTSLWYLPSLIWYLICRYFQIFGFGTVGMNRGFGDITCGTLQILLVSPVSVLFIHLTKIVQGIIGLMTMNNIHFLLLITIDIPVLYLIFTIVLNNEGWNIKSYSGFKRIFVLSIVLITVFEVPLLLHGNYFFSGGSRLYYLVDIGISLFFVSGFLFLLKSDKKKFLFLFIIGFCLIINQGLYYNWVISGNIQHNVQTYIEENKIEISDYDFLYFNSDSFFEKCPNYFVVSDFPYVENVVRITSKLLKPFQINVHKYVELISPKSPDIHGYARYYNAKCMDTWALTAILDEYAPNSNRTVFYINSPEMYYIISHEKDTPISFFDKKTGNYNMVKRENLFEINYSSVFS